MNNFNKKIVNLKTEPFLIFKIDDFFDYNFYLDIKKLFDNNKINTKKLSINDNFGKGSIDASLLSFDNESQKKIFTKLNNIIFSNEFFSFFVKKIYFLNIKNQKNNFRKIKYLRYPILDTNDPRFIGSGEKKGSSIIDFLFSKISVRYALSYIKNEGGIVPHVDAVRKYLSLMLYFPDDYEKEIEYGTTFWKSNSPNFTNKHIENNNRAEEFKSENKILYKSPFVSNCLYGFLRNDYSWHTVEPVNISPSYIRKSININFLYSN